jgi:hypothetical protein
VPEELSTTVDIVAPLTVYATVYCACAGLDTIAKRIEMKQSKTGQVACSENLGFTIWMKPPDLRLNVKKRFPYGDYKPKFAASQAELQT